jgi:putative transposase
VSIRRACATFLIDTSLYHYKSNRGDQAALKARTREITATRVRYGYRRASMYCCAGRDGP